MNLKNLVISPVALFVWTLVVLMVPGAALAVTEEMTWGAAVVQILLPLSFYTLVLCMSRTTGKMVWWLFPFIFFGAFQIVLLFLFGNSIIGVDMFLNVLTTNPAEAFELLGNLLWGIAAVVLLYVPVLTAAAVQAYKKCQIAQPLRLRFLRIGAIGAIVGLVALVCNMRFEPEYRPLCDLYPLNVTYNVKLTADRLYDSAHYPETSAGFRFNAKAAPAEDDQPEIYILAIGETQRADHFTHYGYGRPTTPLLSAEVADGIWYDDVLSQSNTTHKSVPMLLSAASAQDYNRIYRERSIITAFKEAGYHTAFLSNQRRNHAFIDTFGEEADEVTFLADDGSLHRDAELLPRVHKLLEKRPRRLFLVVHLYGAHFVYKERYPAQAAHFLPDDRTAANPANRDCLVNAYDNSLREEDAVLDSLFRMACADGAKVAMLYTADHGENIYDDSRHLFLHASPRPSYYELHVPFLVLTSPAYRAARPAEVAALAANRRQPVQTGSAVFHTMLGMADIQTPAYDAAQSLTSDAYSCTNRFYLNDHNEPVPLTRLKLTSEDLAMFRKFGLQYR